MRPLFFKLSLILAVLVVGLGQPLEGSESTIIVSLPIVCPNLDCAQTSGSVGSAGGSQGGETSEPPSLPPEPPVVTPLSGSGAGDPFDLLPTRLSDEEKLARLSLESFSFIQIGEGVKNFTDNGNVRINGRKHLTVALDYEQVPEVLKTIGMTIFDASNPGAIASFVLRADDERQVYSATIAPLTHAGLYPFNIHILDFRNQRVKKLSGTLQVAGIGALGDTAADAFNSVVRPLTIASGVLAGASPFIALGSIGSFYDIYLLLARGLGALFGALGFRRKRKPWGTVYDSVTKRPLDPAYVTVSKDGVEIASAITDIEGRYGFLVPPGTYELKVSKSHYRFPSQFLRAKKEDELYPNLYFGGPVTTTGEEAIAVNIPMDPLGFDWNEFAKREGDFNQFRFEKELITVRALKLTYVFGFVLALGSLIMAPSVLNSGVFLLYVLLYVFRSLHSNSRRLVTIKQQITNEPLPYVIVKVHLAGINQEVKKLVADQLGRIYFLVRPGTYYLTLEKKNPDGTYYTFYKTEPLDLKRGVLTKDIEIPRFKFTE